MLKQRVMTAVILLGALLSALFHPRVHVFMALMLVLTAASAWEWGRLNGLGRVPAVGCALVTAALALASWHFGWLLPGEVATARVWLVVGVLWVIGGGWLLLRVGVAHWTRIPRWLRLGAGMAVLWLAWLAMTQAREVGINFLLSALALVWVADVCAYFTGRALGQRLVRRKLAPSISPGKSWEGVLGGMAGALALAFAWVWADEHWHARVPSLYTLLAELGHGVLPLMVVLLVGMSVVGDLVESMVKRSVGVKDSSRLLPGHGGVLDRVDALLPTLPLVMMVYAWVVV